MIARLIVALAFVGLLLSAGAGRASAQVDYAGNINSCADLGAGYVDASALVTVTANDGTYLSYTATDAVVGVIKGGNNYRVYPAATAGVALHAPLNRGGNVPAISHYLFCAIPGGEEPPVEDCATDPALPGCDEEPTCATDPALCEEPVDEEPTCATDPALCEEPVDEEPTCATDPALCEEPVDEEPTCATDPALCEEPVDEEPTCPGGTDGYPECNPQIDAEVNLSVDCANPNADGTYTVGGVLSVTNQSEHAQDIRITEVVGPTGDSEAFFLGQEIANGATLSYAYQSVWFAGDDPGAMMVVSASVLFESVQGRGTVREPRGDAEEFYLDAKDSCTGEEPVDEEPTCETDPSLCEEPTCETGPLAVRAAGRRAELRDRPRPCARSRWTRSRWTTSRWTTSRWTRSRWTTSRWTTSRWTRSRWTRSRWTRSRWTTSRWTTSRRTRRSSRRSPMPAPARSRARASTPASSPPCWRWRAWPPGCACAPSRTAKVTANPSTASVLPVGSRRGGRSSAAPGQSTG
jgi:hypothetical protein